MPLIGEAPLGASPPLLQEGALSSAFGRLSMAAQYARRPLTAGADTIRTLSSAGFFIRIVAGVLLFLQVGGSALCAPIEKIQGVIAEVGEGFLLVKPDGETGVRKFILRWKARFVPPKLPLKGDHVLVLYKSKEEGAVIYALNYLKTSSGPILQEPGSAGDATEQ